MWPRKPAKQWRNLGGRRNVYQMERCRCTVDRPRPCSLNTESSPLEICLINDADSMHCLPEPSRQACLWGVHVPLSPPQLPSSMTTIHPASISLSDKPFHKETATQTIQRLMSYFDVSPPISAGDECADVHSDSLTRHADASSVRCHLIRIQLFMAVVWTVWCQAREKEMSEPRCNTGGLLRSERWSSWGCG